MTKKLTTTFINNLTNEELINTFKNHPDWQVRLAVIKKLTDQQLIFNTFKNDSDWIIRRVLVNKLTAPLYIQFFENDKDFSVREDASRKLGKPLFR